MVGENLDDLKFAALDVDLYRANHVIHHDLWLVDIRFEPVWNQFFKADIKPAFETGLN